MDGGILATAIVTSILTLFALYAWYEWSSLTRQSEDDEVALQKKIEDFKETRNIYIFILTFIGGLIALIWIVLWTALTGFHWSVVVAFAWPYAVGYAWGRVQVKVALKRPSSRFVLFSLILTILAFTALLIVTDISQPFPSIFGTTIVTFGHWVINGYALVGVSGLIFTLTLLVSLTSGTGRDIKSSIEDLKRKIEEKERIERETISDEALRSGIKQLLDQGKKVSKEDFRDANENRIRNAMAALERELASAALVYDASATTLTYHNAEGVRQIHDTCSRIARQGSEYKQEVKELTQIFLRELVLPIPSDADVQLRHPYFPMVIGRTRASMRGLPAEFPIFIPKLTNQQTYEENISETFRGLFQEAALALDSRFGLILSPVISPSIRNLLTQRDESGVKENVAYLDEEDMRVIITSKDVEPRTAFLNRIGKQVRFTAVSPFHTRSSTPGIAFVGREREMSEILQNIASRSYVILGARRIGKTSMITQVILQLRKRGYREFYLDCQPVETYQDFFRNARLRWAQELGAYTFSNELPVAFQEMVAYLSQSDRSNLPLVFIFDEIDRLLKFDMNQENPEPFFRTFRALSQQKACQFIFSGERRIYHQLHDPSSSLFNLPIPIKLGLLGMSDAQKLIEEPLADFGIRLDGGRSLTDAIVDACSRHPNLLQEMGHRIFELLDQQSGTSDPKVTKEIVARVINQPDFRKLYQEIFWSQCNALERTITLLVPSDGPVEPPDIAFRLKQHGFKVGSKQLDAALDYLTLCCIFQQDGHGIGWAATHFKEIVSKTIFDQPEYIADLREEFSASKGEV